MNLKNDIFIKAKSIKDIEDRAPIVLKNSEISFSKLDSQFQRSEIKIIWNNKKKKFELIIPEDFNFNPVFNKRILTFVSNYLDVIIDYCNDFKSFEFKLCIGDGIEAGTNSVVFCSNNVDNLLIPDIHFIETFGYRSLKNKSYKNFIDKIDKVYWRGNLTDINLKYRNSDNYELISSRLFFVNKSYDNDKFDIKFSNNQSFFSNHGIDYIYNDLLSKKLLKTEDKQNNIKYKYLLDIDGVVNAWSFLEKMSYGSVIFKLKSKNNFRQWFYDRISNYIHFIFIDTFSDLEELMMQDNQLLTHIASKSFSFFNNMNYDDEIKNSFNAIYEFSKKHY